jgi:hypothetical protein
MYANKWPRGSEWRDKGASIRDMLEFACLRPIDERVHAQFAF